ncbi:MAG: GNAT family N-acetyltransferase [Chloroflexota bacterium]|nr:GNAT family N-acetyltransferase [Chloroflexota bacterium]
MTTSSGPVAIQLLADNEQLVTAIGELRWREWSHAPEPEGLDWWINVTAREAGRDRLPITWVAIDERGGALGAVGIGEFDIEERRNRSPWVLGMIVRPDRRGMGIGSLLLAHLEAWARTHGYSQVWVANEGLAIGFYRKCGWELSETVERASGEAVLVLTKLL